MMKMIKIVWWLLDSMTTEVFFVDPMSNVENEYYALLIELTFFCGFN